MIELQSLPYLLEIIRRADEAVMKFYGSSQIKVTTKSDDSPLTEADLASHKILVSGLAELFPDIPIVSEEGDEQQNKKTLGSKRFWLVDPLDGTKEFLKKTGDFTVCAGLVEEGVPVFGVISVPARGVVYYGGPGMGSYKKIGSEEPRSMYVSNKKIGIVLASPSQLEEATSRFIAEHYADSEIKHVGSQLKLPYIAEGLADAYPRLQSSLHLWDLAAGHSILAGAGGTVERPDGSPVDYHNKTFLTGDIVASS